jgi:preprotein translocase subunit SecF
MELFKNTHFDFLGKKWPFIIASLILTAAGLGSLAIRGGPNYGIDFKGRALLYLRFNQEPPVQKIRAALESKVKGEISVQQITGQPEVLVGTEIRNETELNANRQIIEDTLRTTFGAANGKLDLNNSGTNCASPCSRPESRFPRKNYRTWSRTSRCTGRPTAAF